MANAGSYRVEDRNVGSDLMEGLTPPELKSFKKALEKDPLFDQVWKGGILSSDHHLILRSQIAYTTDGRGNTRLLYNGRRYDRDSWTWRPPKAIRQLGRTAKEYPNPRNSPPVVFVATKNGEFIYVDRCTKCGGDLIYDNNMELYCRECGLIY